MGGAEPAVAENAYLPYFLYFLDDAPPPSSLPRRRAAPPHFTDACTTARGHQGEDDLFPALVDAPAFEPRGGTCCHSAPPHRRW
jgi:hypothetical protein